MDDRVPFLDKSVEAAFAAFPTLERGSLLKLRWLIFDTATKTKGVGSIFETLKWGQPAYLTQNPKSGSTLRLGLPKQGGIAVYAHCQTTIISNFQMLFPNDFNYEGNRAIHFDINDALPLNKIELLIRHAITYHL